MELISNINNTSVYRNPAPQSPLQGNNVMQPPAVYSKILLRTIELAASDYVFDGLAVEKTMPSNNGSNEIVFKRMLSLAAHTQPLVEGIPPASDQGRMVAIKASTKSYGRVMKFTDKVNWAVVDPLISEYTRQLALKVPETKDLLAQQALLAEAQSYYAVEKTKEGTDSDILVPVEGSSVTHIKYLTPDCAPTIDEFRKIVLSMEAAKVRPYQGTNFLVLASSAVIFDLITDKRVKEFMKWTNTATTYTTDMIIDLFSLAFKKAKTIKTDNTYTDADGDTVYIYHAPAFPSGTDTIAVNILTKAPISELGDTDNVTIVNLTTKEESTATKASLANVDYDVLNVHHSIVVGEECLFRIGIEGHTQPQFIKKELGSAGTEDPLNQRQSIGWKIDSLGYKVANPDAVVDYMSCPTQYKVNINARPDLKNQFTDYFYGYTDADGKYWYPEQVMQAVDATDGVVYYVRGTTTRVTPIKMSKLVRPVDSGRIYADGKRAATVGTVPTTTFALATNHAIRFTSNQVVYDESAAKYYIKGTNVEVVKLPASWTDANFIKADGTGVESRTVVDEGTDVNATGDPNIDDVEHQD
jgi:N4-gp56 family major capsid protein